VLHHRTKCNWLQHNCYLQQNNFETKQFILLHRMFGPCRFVFTVKRIGRNNQINETFISIIQRNHYTLFLNTHWYIWTRPGSVGALQPQYMPVHTHLYIQHTYMHAYIHYIRYVRLLLVYSIGSCKHANSHINERTFVVRGSRCWSSKHRHWRAT
jgi:hypothetical protein